MTIGHCSFSLPGLEVSHDSKTGSGIVRKVRMTLSYYIGLCQQRQDESGTQSLTLPGRQVEKQGQQKENGKPRRDVAS